MGLNLNFKNAVTFIMIGFVSLTFPIQSEAAREDDELSIMAAEQRKDNEANVTVREDIETFNNQTPVESTDNMKNNSNSENTKNISKNQSQNTEGNVNNGTNTSINADDQNNSEVKLKNNQSINEGVKETVSINNPKSSDISIGKIERSASNAIKHYSTFEEAAKKVGYIPLYIPKKSGFSMNYIAVVNDNIVEIHYGRRWEPTVTLSIRTYKRAPEEKVKDISGISGVKWKVDVSTGSPIYISRISDNVNAAAWTTGQYTFAAMTENFSFAAFHSLIVEELVDLCNHYFINVNN